MILLEYDLEVRSLLVFLLQRLVSSLVPKDCGVSRLSRSLVGGKANIRMHGPFDVKQLQKISHELSSLDSRGQPLNFVSSMH
jgi:hypothetical protein